MFTEQNEIKRLAVAHVDPKKIKWAWELAKKNPPNINNQTGLAQVLRSGKSEFYPVITDEMLVAAAKDEEDLKIIRKVKFSSVMIVPLIVEGRPIGAITFVHSESNRHFTKADLTIAEEVASRAALAIHNARLFTDSQNAISIRDEFISVASHELKTPVTSLKMYTQIIQKQLALRGETILLAPLSKMNTQIDKLTLLINDLLNISRIQLGKLEFNEEYFNLQDIVEDTVDSVQASTQTHTIHLKGSIHKKVWGDKDRISQVITNLLTNAIKYSPHANSVEIKIHAGKKMAEVCVCDYGIGIEEEQQKKIFNRFYRVVGAEEKTFPGLGIGLYISAEIIRRHGGDISVKSKKGKGSTFIITLPYKKTK
jgi:signal transduction histidine kinase